LRADLKFKESRAQTLLEHHSLIMLLRLFNTSVHFTTNTQTYMHTYIHTYMHTYIYTYIYTYIHTYIHRQTDRETETHTDKTYRWRIVTNY